MPPKGDTGRVQGYSNSRDYASRGGGLGGGGGGGGPGTPAQQQASYRNDLMKAGMMNEYNQQSLADMGMGPAPARVNFGVAPATTAPPTGFAGGPLSSAAADHMIATGRIAVPSIGPNGMQTKPGQSQDDAYTDYARAIGREAVKPFSARALDFFSPFGISNMEVDAQRPWTFEGGTYQPGINLGNLTGSILGGAVFPGAGILGGIAGGAAYDALGFRDVPLAGYGGATPGQNPMQNGGNPTGPGAGPGSPAGSASRDANSTRSTPGGAPFGLQPGPRVPSPAPAAPVPEPMQNGGNPVPQDNGFFSPRLPNHSLPYGYQSAFPGSLSDEDKRLLYAKFLARAA